MPETVETASNSEETSSGVHGRDTVELRKSILQRFVQDGGLPILLDELRMLERRTIR